MKVLIGVDGSSNSLATVAFTGRLLSPADDELVLAYAVPFLPFVGDDQLDPQVADRASKALSSAVFDEALLRLGDAWQARSTYAVLSGPPDSALLSAAEQHAVEMIAVGFRGTGMFERFLLGSVSRAVVHSANVPVLVVKTAGGEDSETPHGTPDGTCRVLAAFDGAEFGQRIATSLGKFTWPTPTMGYVITVVPPMFAHQLPDWLEPIKRDADVQSMAEAWQNDYEQQLQQAGDELRRFQQSLPEVFHTSEPLVAQGRPADRILDAIRNLKIDLAVVGSRGRGAVERLLIGSTSAQLLSQAPCSVLIAR